MSINNKKWKDLEITSVNRKPEAIGATEIKEIEIGEAVYFLWAVDDVLEQAKRMNMNLERSEAKEILHTIRFWSGSDVGVNWGVISDYIEAYCKAYPSRVKTRE